MLLFTWNLHKKEAAFRMALEHLRRSGYSFLGSLQELPPEMGTTEMARDATKRFHGDSVRCLGVTPAGGSYKHGRVGLFCSPNLRAISSDVDADGRQRMAVASLLGAKKEPLLVIGYHGESLLESSTEHDRGRIGAQVRGEIDRRWGQEPLIVLGDFNANPFDAEVCGSNGIFALRDRTEAFKERSSPLVPLGEKQRPLYNPMWSLLAESSIRRPGTFVHDTKLMLRWRLYDQILTSPDLISFIQGAPEILTQIQGQSLVTKQGNPDPDISDHLPVQIRVTI